MKGDPFWRSPAVRGALGWLAATLAGLALTGAANLHSRTAALERRASADDVRWEWIRSRVDDIHQRTVPTITPHKDP